MIKDVKNPKDLKCLKKPSHLQKTNFKNKMGISLAAIALALGIGSFSLLGKNETLTMGVTTDIAEDKYENSIPLFSDKEGKNLLTTIDNKKLIITMDNIKNSDKNDKLHFISTINENDEMVTGYTYKKYMEQLTEIDKETSSNLYRVTSDNGIFLRSSPELKDNKLLSIPSNSILMGTKSQEDTMLWTNVLYYNGATISKGYASGKFLEKINNNKDFKKTITEKINKNAYNKFLGDTFSAENNYMGIDVSYINPKILDKLLKGQIKLPEIIEKRSGEKVNLSEYNRKIDYVFFKVIGTLPFAKNLKEGKTAPYKELAEICQKNQIPFGVYLYSTCTTPEESEQEYKIFAKHLKSLKNYSYFLLPTVVDIEVANENDRQYNVSIEELTNSKINLVNKIEKDFGKTILYIPRNAYDERLNSRILDLPKYQAGLNSGKSHIWHVAPLNSRAHGEALARTSKTEPVTMKQIVLDAKVHKNQYDLIDINLMDKTAYNEYITGRYIDFEQTREENNKKYLAENEI